MKISDRYTTYSAKLPDAFRKDVSSNNAKILEINRSTIEDFKKDTADVVTMLDIWQATGATLDLYGDMLSQPRGNADDNRYRYKLMMKVAQYLSKGDYNSCISAILNALDISSGEVEMIEHESKPAVKFVKFPIEILYKTGFKSTEMYELIKSLLPAGVELIIDWFDGTFELAAEENEFDNAKGMADNAGTIGGLLGLAYKEDI